MDGLDGMLNQVVEGDCLKVMERIPDGTVDFVLSDLPYGITRNPWDTPIDMELLWRQYDRVLKSNGAIALTGQGLFTAHLIHSNPKWFRYKIVWIKSKAPNFLSAGRQPMRKHEDICIFYRRQPTYNVQMLPGEPYDRGVRNINTSGSYGKYQSRPIKSNGGRFPYDVVFYEEEHPDWLYFKTAEPGEQSWHPTQKPVALGAYLIRTYTSPGDMVLDNACGCGSFLVAAVREGRKFIGIEKNVGGFRHGRMPIDFVAIARQRVAEEYGKNGR